MIRKTKNVAPSTDLRQWYNNDPASWKGFKTRYLRYMEYRRAGNQSAPYGINEDGVDKLTPNTRSSQLKGESTMFKKTTIFAVLLAGTVSMSPAFAADEHNTVPGLTAAGKSLGLHGIDPVAFVIIDNRIEGSAKYTGVHDGVAYYFSSDENLQAFKKNPQRYTPQNGGFCTFGVSVGKKFDGNPRYAAVENGKLYVFLNETIFGEFQKDRAGTISKAATNWKKIQHAEAASL